MAGLGSDCNKRNAKRHSVHAAWYASLPPKVKKRKDRNVLRSSHGKFRNVEELVAAQRESEARKGIKPAVTTKLKKSA